MKKNALPPHLVNLMQDEEWALWRWVGLRGTGFPAANIFKLTAPNAAAAADHLLQAETALACTFERGLDTVNQALDDLRAAQQWHRAEIRKPLLAALSTLKKGNVPQPIGNEAIDAAFTAVQKASNRFDEAQHVFEQAYAGSVLDTSIAIRDILANGRFREAVVWQNRHAFHTGMASLLRYAPEDRSSQVRQHEELVASYWQRYSLKNDTIGFFGPVGWATIEANARYSSLCPGSELLTTRKVYFEGWGIDMLAKIICQDETLKPWLAPRPLPYFHLEGNTLHVPMRQPVVLPATLTAVLNTCNGQKTAQQIAVELIDNPATGLQNEAQVYKMLKQLQQWKLINWAIEVPLETYPEHTLRSHLEQIGDPILRQSAINKLNELEAARQGIADAAGHADQLEEAFIHLEQTFTRLTGSAPTQSHGEVYGARTLVYEDCRRDMEMHIGQDILAAVALPLTLLLNSVRWFTTQLAAQVEQVAHQVYDELVAESGTAIIDTITFAKKAERLIFDMEAGPVPQARAAFQQRWLSIFDLPENASQVHFCSEALREQVAEMFAADKAGWQYGRYHSPDLLIAAPSFEAIQQGDFQIVLGELHLTANNLGASLWLAQHPAPHELFQAIAHDLSESLLLYAIPKNWPTKTARTHLVLAPPQAQYLLFGNDPIKVSPAQTVPIGSLVVEEENGRLRMRSRDHQQDFDLIEALSNMLTVLASELHSHFKLTNNGFHAPRITIDKLVISRETWYPQVQALGFAHLKNEEDRFLAMRRWAKEHQLPRFIFASIPTEKKPLYIDLDSPIYINIFAKAVRRAQRADKGEETITLAEMLPRPDQTWLSDGAGQRYTSELRFVALDLA